MFLLLICVEAAVAETVYVCPPCCTFSLYGRRASTRKSTHVRAWYVCVYANEEYKSACIAAADCVHHKVTYTYFIYIHIYWYVRFVK